jgi:hypothetical protein
MASFFRLIYAGGKVDLIEAMDRLDVQVRGLGIRIAPEAVAVGLDSSGRIEDSEDEPLLVRGLGRFADSGDFRQRTGYSGVSLTLIHQEFTGWLACVQPDGLALGASLVIPFTALVRQMQKQQGTGLYELLVALATAGRFEAGVGETELEHAYMNSEAVVAGLIRRSDDPAFPSSLGILSAALLQKVSSDSLGARGLRRVHFEGGYTIFADSDFLELMPRLQA